MRGVLVALVTAAVAASAAAQTFAAVDPNASAFQTQPVCAIEGAECNDSIGCCEPERLVCRASDVTPDSGDRKCLPIQETCYKMGSPCDAQKWCCGAEPDGNGLTENIQCKPFEGDPDGPQDSGWYCQKIYYEENDRCMGEEGKPYIVWRECAEGLVCRPIEGGLWGSFCVPPLAEASGEEDMAEAIGEEEMMEEGGEVEADGGMGDGDIGAGDGGMDAGDGDMAANNGGESAGDGSEGMSQ